MKVTRKDPEPPPKPSFVVEMSYEEAEFLAEFLMASRFENADDENMSCNLYNDLYSHIDELDETFTRFSVRRA